MTKGKPKTRVRRKRVETCDGSGYVAVEGVGRHAALCKGDGCHPRLWTYAKPNKARKKL